MFRQHELREALVAEQFAGLERHGLLVGCLRFRQSVQPGLCSAELLPQRRLVRESLEQRFGVRDRIRVTPELEARGERLAPHRIPVRFSAKDLLVEEDDLGLAARRRVALAHQFGEPHLRIDVVGLELEVLPVVVDRAVELVGLSCAFRLTLQRLGDAVGLDRVHSEEHAGQEPHDEDEFE